SDLLFGGNGDDVFQVIPDDLPVLPGTNRSLLPTLSDMFDGGPGYDQVLFLGGDADSLGRPVPDFVSMRWDIFLHRYEFTSLVWDTANQRFLPGALPAVLTATAPLAQFDLPAGASFQLVLNGDTLATRTVAVADRNRTTLEDLVQDVNDALSVAGLAQLVFA